MGAPGIFLPWHWVLNKSSGDKEMIHPAERPFAPH